MERILNNKKPRLFGGANGASADPDKTSDLSAAAAAVAAVSAKPTHRSARGSAVVKQEKRERRERRANLSERSGSRTRGMREDARIAFSGAYAVSAGAGAGALAWAGAEAGASGSTRRAKGGTMLHASDASERNARAGSGKGSGKGTGKSSTSGTSGRTARAGKKKPGSTASSDRAFLKYANDNVVVRWFYQLTTGPQRHLFYLAVVALVALGIYMPVRDFYIAQRTAQILQEQKEIRDAYNETVGDEVNKYMSQEGIEDTARKELGMVMPGEQTITVQGLDEDGNPVTVQDGVDQTGSGDGSGNADDGSSADGSSSDASTDGEGSTDGSTDASADGSSSGDASGDAAASGTQGSDEDSGTLKGSDAADKSKTGSDAATYDPSKKPTTSAEVEAAEKAVFENSPWYWKMLDALFFFDGVNGMAVVSTGE